MAKTNKKAKKTKMSPKTKRLILSIMGVVIALSIVMAVVFGFNLHLYGKKFTVTFNAKGGQVTPISMVVEYGKEYSLPKATKGGEVFAYWRITSTQKKVELKGTWRIDRDVTLVVVWQGEVGSDDNGGEWTGNY